MSESGFQRKIRQTKPFRSEETEALVALFYTADRVRSARSSPFQGEGLSPEQYNILRILRGAGKEGLRTYQVVTRMIARAPNITRLVDKLEKRGLLSREKSESDRRVIVLRISEPGLALLERLDRPVEQFSRKVMAGLDTKDTKRLIGLLGQLCETVEPALS